MRTLLVSDFNVQSLANYLENADEPPPFDITISPFGQVQRTLLDDAAWSPKPDCAVVWTQAHRVVTAFRELVEGHMVSRAELV